MYRKSDFIESEFEKVRHEIKNEFTQFLHYRDKKTRTA